MTTEDVEASSWRTRTAAAAFRCVRFLKTLAPALLLASSALVLLAQPATNPEDLYQRVRRRVMNDITRLPNFTCVETIRRRVYGVASPKARPPNCGEIVRDYKAEKPGQPLQLSDRLRVDVAIAGKHEVYSWVGAERFEEEDLHTLVGNGQTVMGDFGSHLLAVFAPHGAMQFIGERKVGGRRLLEYSYQTPLNLSEYYLRVGGTAIKTAYEGSVLLDPATADVARVTARSAELPEETGYCQVTNDLDYARLRIDVRDMLIPSQATSWAVGRDGVDLENVSAYSNCREYLGESVLRFDDPEADSASVRGAATPGPNASQVNVLHGIPAGLPFECRVVSTIDSDTAAAGDPVRAVLRSAIADANGNVLAPAGIELRGRLVAVVQHPATPKARAFLQIGIQLRFIELNGALVPFAATLVQAALGGVTPINLHPNVGTFVFHQSRVRLANLDAKWVTSTPVATRSTR